MSLTQSQYKFTLAPPLSLYIHFPWCVAKCPYCDFNSHAMKQPIDEAAYCQQLIADLQHSQEKFAHYLQERPIRSIFMGGGTPSLFSGTALATLLDKIKKILPVNPDAEITLEANPGTVEQQRFHDYYQAGINRLSLGIQSFDDGMLKKLGRIHDSREAHKAIACARAAGFNNLNLDLMFGLPQQSIKQAFYDLDQAFAAAPTHISWYQLTLEPNTLFFKHPPPIPTEDQVFDIYQFGQQRLLDQGYRNYEISAYGKEGYYCQHNMNYWQFGDYLGIGAGAHSKLTAYRTGEIVRFVKHKQPKLYLKTTVDFLQSREIIAPAACAFEFMLNALRLNQPIPLSLFTERTGLEVRSIETPLKTAIAQGMLSNSEGNIHKTHLGQRFVDDILQLFL